MNNNTNTERFWTVFKSGLPATWAVKPELDDVFFYRFTTKNKEICVEFPESGIVTTFIPEFLEKNCYLLNRNWEIIIKGDKNTQYQIHDDFKWNDVNQLPDIFDWDGTDIYRVKPQSSVKVEPLLSGDFTQETIKSIEQTYNGKFIMETCLKSRNGGWTNTPWMLFYSNGEAHPRGSKWFALGYNGENFVITDGQSAIDDSNPHYGYFNPETGEAVYSIYRWDCHSDKSKTFSVDGGRDYVKIVGQPPKGFLYGKFVVVFNLETPEVHFVQEN